MMEFKQGTASLTGLSVVLSLAVLGLNDRAPASPGLTTANYFRIVNGSWMSSAMGSDYFRRLSNLFGFLTDSVSISIVQMSGGSPFFQEAQPPM